MQPCTEEQLVDTLNKKDDIGIYKVATYYQSSQEADVVYTKQVKCIDVTYPPISKLSIDGYYEMVDLYLDTDGVVKARYGKNTNIIKFANHKNIDDLVAKLIPRIRKFFGIKQVF